MSEENIELVRGGYDVFNGGNPMGMIARLADNVEWTEPGGGNAPSGTFNGPDAVASEVLPKVPENFDEFTCEPEDIKGDGDAVVATGRFKGKSKSGVELDAPFTHTYEVKDGKITKLDNDVSDNWAEAWGG